MPGGHFLPVSYATGGRGNPHKIKFQTLFFYLCVIMHIAHVTYLNKKHFYINSNFDNLVDCMLCSQSNYTFIFYKNNFIRIRG